MIDDDARPFPYEALVEIAAHWENVGLAWSGPEKRAKQLRAQYLGRAAEIRYAIRNHKDLVQLCNEMREQLEVLVGAPGAE